MSNKLGIMLSLVIFFQSLLVSLDLYTMQQINTRLVIGSNYVNSLIIKNGGVNLSIVIYVKKEMDANLYVIGDKNPGPGEPLTYKIVMQYKRIYSNEVKEMSITRSVLFGYTLR